LQPQNNFSRAALEDSLITYLFPPRRIAGSRAEGSENARGPRQIALGLRESARFYQGIDVIGHNLQNLIELSERFREITKRNIELSMESDQIQRAMVKPIGL